MAGWQRSESHLAGNAIQHAPNVETARRIGRQLKSISDTDGLAKARNALADSVASSRDSASKLADWLERNVPEGLAAFTLPEHHRRRLRTSNPIEGSVRARNVNGAPSRSVSSAAQDAFLHLVSAVLVEIDGKWASETKA